MPGPRPEEEIPLTAADINPDSLGTLISVVREGNDANRSGLASISELLLKNLRGAEGGGFVHSPSSPPSAVDASSVLTSTNTGPFIPRRSGLAPTPSGVPILPRDLSATSAGAPIPIASATITGSSIDPHIVIPAPIEEDPNSLVVNSAENKVFYPDQKKPWWQDKIKSSASGV